MGCTRSLLPVVATPKPRAMPDFRFTLSVANGVIWCIGSNPFCIKCFKTLILCLGLMNEASGGIYWSIMCYPRPLPPDFVAKIVPKIQGFEFTISLANGVMGNKEIQSLLLKCCKTLLVCIYQNVETVGGICQSIMSYIWS